jgi:hypothetical protein
MAQILARLFQPNDPPLIAVCLFRLFDSPQRSPRSREGFLRRHTATLVLLFQQRDV